MDPIEADRPLRLTWRAVALYAVLIGAGIAGFYVIKHLGRDLVAPALPGGGEAFGTGDPKLKFDVLVHVLLALATIIVTARVLGGLFAKLNQPPVIGEVLAGILLGPSLLGRIAPSVSAYVLPTSVAPFLSVLAQVGVILYMFLVGLELDTRLLRKRTHATVAVSHASIVLPFVLGCGLALLLYPRVSTRDVPFTYFALFCGVAMSVTAFPVLARILTDRGVQTSRLGVTALACAAVDDVTAWCLLAFVVSVVKARAAGGLLTFGLTLGYLGLIVFARPFLLRVIQHHERSGEVNRNVLTVVLVGLLLSSLATEYIGIHAVFGAFVLGAIIPAESKISKELLHKLEDFVVVLFLPAFFAYTGMRTQVGLVSGAGEWLLCGLIIVTACVGKFGGSFAAARLSGISWRDSAALGVLMNTRGLMELIVLNIGLDMKVISPTLFAMLVIMAIVTTMATTPILDVLTGRRERDVAGAAAAVASRVS